jgi:hypothetical protein
MRQARVKVMSGVRQCERAQNRCVSDNLKEMWRLRMYGAHTPVISVVISL